MASASDPGLNFKISGQVDPNFIASVASAKDNVAKSNVESKSWQATLKSLGGTLGGAAKFVGALALEQQLHHARTKNSTAATKEQSGAIEKLTSTMVPLTAQLKALVDLQTKQISQAPQQTAAIQQQAQAMTSATSAAQGFGGAVSDGSGHLDTFKNAAQSAFSGNLTGAVQTLGASVASFALPVTAAIAAVALLNQSFKMWEESEIRVGKQLEDDSASLQKAISSWREYGVAVDKAAKSKQSFVPIGPVQKGNLSQEVASIRANVAGLSPSAAYSAIGGKSPEDVRKQLDNINAVKDQTAPIINELQRQLNFLNAPENKNKTGVPIKDKNTAYALGKGDQFEIARVARASKPEIETALKQQKALYAEFAKGRGELEEYEKKVRTFASALDEMGKRSDRIKEITAIGGQLGGRTSLVQAKQEASRLAGAALDTYKTGTNVKDTSTSGLLHVLADPTTDKGTKDATQKILDVRKQVTAASKAISDFDDAAAKKEIENNKTKISQLQEQLALRKAMGHSSLSDEAKTINQQLDLTKDTKDYTGVRTELLNKKSENRGKSLEASLKDSIGAVQQAYKELASTGTATSAELSAANAKVTSAAVNWKNANASVLEQYPKLKEQIDSIASAAKVESGHIQQKTFAEQFQTLKTHIEAGSNAAQGLQDRLKATKTAIDETNAAYAKGLINQKQATEELSVLSKERANQERAIAEAMEQQHKAIDALKGKMSGNELKRLESDKAAGRDPAFFEQRKEQLQASEVKSQMKVIDDEYQAAVKGNKDQVLAAEEATLKKKLLYEQEADKFIGEEDRKTSALKAANKNRLGGEASPLVGLGEGASFSGVGFSGFGNFGDNFGKFSRTRSAFDTYSDGQMPGAVGDMFKQRQSYEGSSGKAQSSSTTNHYNVTAEHMPKGIVEDFCKAASEAAKYMGAVSGSGAPAMTQRSSSDVWDKSGSADSWQK